MLLSEVKSLLANLQDKKSPRVTTLRTFYLG